MGTKSTASELGYEEAFKNNSEGTDEGGQSKQDSSPVSGSGSTPGVFAGGKLAPGSKILGMPYGYCMSADPTGRIFKNTYCQDANVCFFKVGVMAINRWLYSKIAVDESSDENNIGGLANGLRNALISGGIGGFTINMTQKDKRLIYLDESGYEEYKVAAEALANTLAGYCDGVGFYSGDESIGMIENFGIPFFCSKDTECNEGISNTYSAMEMVEKSNEKARKTRENYMLYGTYGDVKIGAGDDAGILALKNMLTGVVEDAANSLANTGEDTLIGGIASAFNIGLRGSMLLYGQIFSDASTNLSYSLSFKFSSPYGDKKSILQNVLLPFALLLAMGLPRQDSKQTYKEPFIVAINYPGMFNISCGVIKSISWVKGGSNQLWSVDRLPLELSVTIEVEDLYPTMMSSPNEDLMQYNQSLANLAASLAGITSGELGAVELADSFKKLS